jgi:hypothetical protein
MPDEIDHTDEYHDPPNTLPLDLTARLPWVLWQALMDAPPPPEPYTPAGVAMAQLMAQLRTGSAHAVESVPESER